eukprot:479824-Rhodomonas_salina.1
MERMKEELERLKNKQVPPMTLPRSYEISATLLRFTTVDLTPPYAVSATGLRPTITCLSLPVKTPLLPMPIFDTAYAISGTHR